MRTTNLCEQSDLTCEAIRAASRVIAPYVLNTPVLSNRFLDEACGGQLFFKCECLQKAGAFKSRGACFVVFSLSERQAAAGVATHSSGNHAAALARAAALRGIPAHIVMPEDAPLTKQKLVRSYGGRIVFCKPGIESREAACAKVLEETGATLVHPYNDYRIMAGQGTASLELLEQTPDLDVVLTPVGGGGLLAGTAVAVKGISSKTRVIGVEPEQADDARRSFLAGERVAVTPNTIADGLRTLIGERNLSVILEHVDDIVTVSEEAIVAAMRSIWERLKVVVEPSSAVPLAAVLDGGLDGGALDVKGQRVGIILSGGNLDLDRLPWLASAS